MSTADFGSTGNMKNATIHVGSINCYDNLYVEDDMNVDGNVTLTGKVVCKDGIQIGDTLFDENTLKSGTTPKGILSTWDKTEPSPKKLRIDPVKGDGVDGLVHDTSGEFFKVDRLASRDQIVTPTGVLAQSGSTDMSFITPTVMGSKNTMTDNIEPYNNSTNSILTVKHKHLAVDNITATTGNSLTIKSGTTFTEPVFINSAISGAAGLIVESDLTVNGNTTFNNNVTFNHSGGTVSIPGTLIVNKIDCPDINNNGTNTMDDVKTDKISANKDASINVASPVRNVKVLLETEKNVFWDTITFYREYDSTNNYAKSNTYFTDDGNGNVTYQTGSANPDGTLIDFTTTTEKLDTFAFYHGLYSQETDWFEFCSPLALINMYMQIKPIIKESYRYKAVKFYEAYRENKIAQKIYDRCKDKTFLEKMVTFLNYIKEKSSGNYCGATELAFGFDSNNNKLLNIKLWYNGLSYTDISIKLDDFTFTYKKGSGSGTFNIVMVSNGVAYVIKDSDGTVIERNTMDVKDELDRNVLTYILFYPFIRVYETIYQIKRTIIRKKGDNAQFVANWPTPLLVNNFDKLGDYIKWWKEKEEEMDWMEFVWNNVSKFIDNIDLKKPLNFLETSTDDINIWNIYNPTYVEWDTAIKSGATKCWIDYKRDTEITSMEIWTLAEDTTVVPPVMKRSTKAGYLAMNASFYPKMSIGEIVGDTTITGNLEVSSISNTNDGPVNITYADIKQLFVNGNQITPSASNTAMEMGYKTHITPLYREKVTGSDAQNGKAITINNENGNSETFDFPSITMDYNYCGNVYLVTVRPFYICRRPLIEEFVATSKRNNGFGRFDLPFSDFNFYALEMLERTKTTGSVTETIPKYIINTTSLQDLTDAGGSSIRKFTCYPNGSNWYQLAQTNYQWIICLKDNTTQEYKYVTYYRGLVRFFVQEGCSKCVNMDWLPINDKTALPTSTENYIPPTGTTYVCEYVAVEGFRFNAPGIDPTEKTNNTDFFKYKCYN